MAKKKQLKRANGTGCIINLGERRRKPFGVRVTAGFKNIVTKDGEVVSRQNYVFLGYYTTKTEAELALAIYNNDPTDPTLFNMTIEQAFQQLMVEKTDVSKSTKNNYMSAFNKVSHLHKMKVRQVTTSVLQRELDKLDTGQKQEYVKTFCSVLFNWCVGYRIIRENPASYLKVTRKSIKRERSIYSSEEIRRLWENKDLPACKVALLQIYTSCRISEALNIKKEDIHLEEEYIEVHGTKTENSDRIVPIREEIKELLIFEKDYIVTTKTGRHYDASYFTNSVYNPTMEKLNMEHHTTHDARHTFISLADDAGMNQTALKYIVGHAREGVTEKVYTHKNIEMLQREINKISFF